MKAQLTAAALTALLSLGASAAPKKFVVGVYLPTSIADGQERFKFSEALAAKLTAALNTPVSAKNFGRYEDYAKDQKEGRFDLVVVDAWVAAEAPAAGQLLALGSIGGQTFQRWGLVTRSKVAVKDLAGKRLALTKAVSSLDAKFLANVVFSGDLNAQKHFKLLPVPTVESALKAVEVKGADAALVPVASAPKEGLLSYRSVKVPGVVVLSHSGDAAAQQAAFTELGAVGPFDKFVATSTTELTNLRALITKGPAKRVPQVTESPVLRLNAAQLVSLQEVGLVLPSFFDSMDISNEQPDD